MNVTEALKLLQEGKKISHKDNDSEIYQLIGSLLLVYSQNDDKSYILYYDESVRMNFPDMLEGWFLFTKPMPIDFDDAKFFYSKGLTIKRIKTNKYYNKNNLVHNTFTMEDIDADDWEIVQEKSVNKSD